MSEKKYLGFPPPLQVADHPFAVLFLLQNCVVVQSWHSLLVSTLVSGPFDWHGSVMEVMQLQRKQYSKHLTQPINRNEPEPLYL